IILDNMNDGVTLFDKDFRWEFSNRQHLETMRYARGLVHPGASIYDLIRHNVRNGEHGPYDDFEKAVAQVASRVLKPGGTRYERRTASGKYVEFNYKRLDDGSLLGLYRDITALREREEALATAKDAAEAARDTAERANAEIAAARE